MANLRNKGHSDERAHAPLAPLSYAPATKESILKPQYLDIVLDLCIQCDPQKVTHLNGIIQMTQLSHSVLFLHH